MAITKLGHMKECSKGNPGRHLKNAIAYILNPEKTEHLALIGGNSGYTAEEVYNTFLSTKELYDKPYGRQGYHFIISFKPGEATQEQVYKMAKQWCEEYLGEEYDYVFAVHNDQEHIHAHVIFNSVSLTDGYKYRYEKGDWKKQIQPVTDRICEEMGLPKLQYEPWEKKGKHYAEHKKAKEKNPNKSDVLRADIDMAVNQAADYKDFLQRMEQMGYIVKEGFSKRRNKAFLYFKSPEMGNFRKSNQLGSGYDLHEIIARIEKRQAGIRNESPVRTPDPRPPHMKGTVPDSGTVFGRNTGSNIHMRFHQYRAVYFITGFQIGYVKRAYRAKHIYSPYAVRNAAYRRDISRVHQLSENCRYLLENKITDRQKLDRQLKALKEEVKKEKVQADPELQKKLKNDIRIAKRIVREINRPVQTGGLVMDEYNRKGKGTKKASCIL